MTWSRFDLALTGTLLVACEAEVIYDVVGQHPSHGWPLAVEILLTACVTVPLAGRRRAPLGSLIVVMTCLPLVAATLPNASTPQLLLFIAPYSVAAYAPRNRALLGLAYSGAAIGAIGLLTGSGGLASWLFSLGVWLASWTVGRTLHSSRAIAAELQRTTDRIAAERGARELLAIAEQRTRIALELQTLVAHSVSTMIVQTQAAQRLLEGSPEHADAAMSTIEETGRQALTEMRRILGVLRHPDDAAELAPQPGIGQIPALVEQARQDRQQVTLTVEGEPGPLPASVDLGLYRILQEALSGSGDKDVLLRFCAEDVQLTVVTPGRPHLDWPTPVMRERVALCQGGIDVDEQDQLVVRLPRLFEGART